ncbi:MAG: porin [gamma proteobacterium symbiont of Lucinoma myriamae]|nr:porin [gamma proteobacterium symbiont of Lucinoma myriamae]MCU7818188.1 porin [gamma proteobacterium symbiont of Lucinoma myriamae]MCU7831157.1 porin [gamma proteobacterium symbiont of Lucinoma myriamae]
MKKLIAAAVAAAVIAPVSVMASGPVLYGKLHMSANMLDNNGSNSVAYGNTKYDEVSLNSNHSRIGFKGSEDLGNGMKVGYLIEWSVDMDGDSSKAGGGDLGERNRAVTLSGDWGTMLVGKWDTPFKTVGRKVELFSERLGDQRNMNAGAVLDARAENVIAYVTPNMNGFSATVAYVFDVEQLSGTNGADNSDYSAISFNAIYNNGPILAAFGYANYSDENFGTNMEDQTTWRLAGSYSFGDFKVLGNYTDISDGMGNDGSDSNIWTVGGSYKMGNNTIKLQYATRDEFDDTKGSVDSGDETGASQWAIGLDHTMSKRTTVYVEYADLSNDDYSSSTSWKTMGNGATVGQDSSGLNQDTDGFGVGIIHKF